MHQLYINWSIKASTTPHQLPAVNAALPGIFSQAWVQEAIKPGGCKWRMASPSHACPTYKKRSSGSVAACVSGRALTSLCTRQVCSTKTDFAAVTASVSGHAVS